MKPSDVVLVTAAAGGTGQFAVSLLPWCDEALPQISASDQTFQVQWAKHKGCKTVIGTCSTEDKVEFLKVS